MPLANKLKILVLKNLLLFMYKTVHLYKKPANEHQKFGSTHRSTHL